MNQEATREPGPAGWPEVEQVDIRESHVSPIATPVAPLAPTVTQRSSPEWDIDALQTQARPDADLLLELELNPSDEEVSTHMAVGGANKPINTGEDQAPSSKKRRAND